MEQVANDMRKFAVEFYRRQPLKYHLEKYVVFKLARFGSFIPSSIGQNLLSSPFGTPVGRLLHRNFCGGETLEEALACAANYQNDGIGTILDLVGEPGTEDAAFNTDINKCLPVIPQRHNLMCAVKMSALFGPKKLELISEAVERGEDVTNALSKYDNNGAFDILLSRLKEIRDKQSYRVAIDAEWSDIQPAISQIALKLMEHLNKEQPFLLNTYQAYLRRSLSQFEEHVAHSKSQGFLLGAKIVRGAYMTYENKQNPGLVFDEISLTHQSFDKIIEHAVEQKMVPSSIILASHNEDSVAKAVCLKEKFNDNSVMFAQLHGMRDFVTFFLASRKLPVFKYVPYGTVSEAVPYLARRAEENSGFIDTLKYEKELITGQLFKKLMG